MYFEIYFYLLHMSLQPAPARGRGRCCSVGTENSLAQNLYLLGDEVNTALTSRKVYFTVKFVRPSAALPLTVLVGMSAGAKFRTSKERRNISFGVAVAVVAA